MQRNETCAKELEAIIQCLHESTGRLVKVEARFYANVWFTKAVHDCDDGYFCIVRLPKCKHKRISQNKHAFISNVHFISFLFQHFFKWATFKNHRCFWLKNQDKRVHLNKCHSDQYRGHIQTRSTVWKRRHPVIHLNRLQPVDVVRRPTQRTQICSAVGKTESYNTTSSSRRTFQAITLFCELYHLIGVMIKWY